jgi:hypothetical protein
MVTRFERRHGLESSIVPHRFAAAGEENATAGVIGSIIFAAGRVNILARASNRVSGDPARGATAGKGTRL